MKRRDLLAGMPALMAGGLAGTWSASSHAEPVVQFGQSASLTGGQEKYGKDVRDGIAAALAAVSKADKAMRFELISLDDGGDRERCVGNVKSLIASGVTALVGLTSGAAAEACLPIIEQSKIPLIGTASGNMGIRGDKLTMAYHVRAGYDEEYRRMVRYLQDYQMKRVGYVYLKDTSPANQKAMTAALDAVAIKLTETTALDRNTKSFDAAAETLLAAKLDCVLFTTNAAPIVDLVDRMSAGGFRGFYFSSSFAGQSLIDAMATKGQTIVMSQVVPRPKAVQFGVVKRYQDDLKAMGGELRSGFTSLEGYIAGRVAAEAARAALKGGSVSRAGLKDALSNLSIDLGGYPVNFTGGPRGSHFVDVVAIDRTGRIIG
jgi:branched-chain amino acid transport system substrate-binding protein